MDLKYNKEKMTNNYKSNEIDFEKKINDINYDLLLKKYEEQFGDIIKNTIDRSVLETNPDLISTKKDKQEGLW